MKSNTRPRAAAGFLAILLCAQVGCGPGDPGGSAGSLAPEGASTLQNELDRLNELPFEPEPELRPLVLSQPAPDRRQWVLQSLLEGYAATGRTNVLWDAEVRRVFEAFADYTRVSTEDWPVLEKALETVAATGCDDPMIQYMHVRYSRLPKAPDETALDFLRAYEAMHGSEHHPVFKFFAAMRAAQSSREAEPQGGQSRLLQWTMAHLEDLARDTNAPADEVFDSVNLWFDTSRSPEWTEYVNRRMEPVLEKNWSGSARWFLFRGRIELARAWDRRGGDYAHTVAEAGWKGFAEHLQRAEDFLESAWARNPNSAETAYLMMRLELGQGHGRQRMETWFQRAMSLNPNFYDAAVLMAFYLEPRWYGADSAALAFARSCVASDQWGGQVPLVLADVHRSLAGYYDREESPEYWHRPPVWNDVRSSYEKFFQINPEAVGWRHNYAADAYRCGQYAVFLEQLELFARGTNYAYFGGPEKFDQMVQTALAATKQE